MKILDLGIKEYTETLGIQREVLARRIRQEADDTLIIVEHYPVVTAGKSRPGENNVDVLFCERNNIPIVTAARGGGATFHAPGQLVLYPIISLAGLRKSVSFYIDFLEKAIGRGLNTMGVPAHRIPGKRGVWLEGGKIAFTGVAVKKWVTYHGVSVNINNDISPFFHMDPCGEKGITVTSVKAWAGRESDMSTVKDIFVKEFLESFDAEYCGPGPAADGLSFRLAAIS